MKIYIYKNFGENFILLVAAESAISAKTTVIREFPKLKSVLLEEFSEIKNASYETLIPKIILQA